MRTDAPRFTPDELEARLNALPRAALGCWPTPLEVSPRLGPSWGGPPLLIKRDDLSGLAQGGNKVRNLEFRLGRALAEGCDAVVMAREPYSNNARQTTAAAARLGLRMVLLIPSEQPVPLQGNRLLEEMLGAEVRVIPSVEPAVVAAAVREAVEREQAAGRKVWDNDARQPGAYGALGYFTAAIELVRQCESRGLEPAAVYIAGGYSYTGLLLGLRLLGRDWPVIGPAVEDPSPVLLPKALAAAEGAMALLGLPNPLEASDFEIQDEALGEGFQRLTEAARQVMFEAGRLDGLILDPVYTAKVAAGLRADLLAGRWHDGAGVIFVHTGGVPALFSMTEQVLERVAR